jgi:hypothetical protein
MNGLLNSCGLEESFMTNLSRGIRMENQIVCPHCKKPVESNSIIEDARKGEGSAEQAITHDCGERISYWQITAQFRDQQTVGWKFKNWFRGLSHSRG